jgi:signal transduction histidine kinase
VIFSTTAGRLEVVIADDGHGMDMPPSAADRPHYGLRAMRERADAIGATLDWTNPPDGGCRVDLAVTIAPDPVVTGAA